MPASGPTVLKPKTLIFIMFNFFTSWSSVTSVFLLFLFCFFRNRCRTEKSILHVSTEVLPLYAPCLKCYIKRQRSCQKKKKNLLRTSDCIKLKTSSLSIQEFGFLAWSQIFIWLNLITLTKLPSMPMYKDYLNIISYILQLTSKTGIKFIEKLFVSQHAAFISSFK